MAAFKGNRKAVTNFLSDGIGVDARGPDGERPLRYAVFGDRIAMVKLLLDKGADVNGTNKDESTPLHGAAWKGHLAVAELLIARGAEVNAKNQRGKTPLDWAIEQGHPDVAELIRNHGGDSGNCKVMARRRRTDIDFLSQRVLIFMIRQIANRPLVRHCEESARRRTTKQSRSETHQQRDCFVATERLLAMTGWV